MDLLSDHCALQDGDIVILTELKLLVLGRIRFLFYGEGNAKPTMHSLHKVSLFLYPPTKKLTWIQQEEKSEVMNYVKEFIKNVELE